MQVQEQKNALKPVLLPMCFRDTLQVSALAYANNLNRPGFSYSDLSQTAGLQRSSSVSGGSSTNISNNGSGGSITINGVNFGGSTNGGIATSKGAGFNINHAPNLKKSFFLQYFYGNVETDKQTVTDVKQYNADTIITNYTGLAATTFNTTHNIGIGMRLKPDSVTNFVATANYTVGLQNDYKNSNIYAVNNIIGSLSNGSILNNNVIDNYYYRHAVSLIKLSKTKAGRRLVLSHSLDISNRLNFYNTNAFIHYNNPSAYDSLLQQQRNEGIPRTDLSVTANYTEPLNKKISIRIISRYEYSKLNNAVNTFNKGTGNAYDKFNPALSSFLSRESDRLNSSINFDFKWKDVTLTPTIRALWQKADNYLATLSAPIKQNYFNILPGFVFNYKQLYINYDEGMLLPSYNYLIPIPDNSNPYNIVKGNVNLLPTDRHNISINYYFNNPKKLLNVNLNGAVTFTNNDVIQSIVVDNKGIQTNTPVNANGSQIAWLNYNINKQHKYSNNFTLSWNTGAYYEYNHTKLLYNGEDSWQTTNVINQWAGFNLNFNDKLEWNNSYSISYVFTNYTSNAFTKLDFTRHYLNTEFIVRWPKHVIWENSFNYSYNSSVPAGLPKDLLRWNAAINFTMLKDERGVLRLSVYDLLERNNNINMYVNRNLINTTVNNILPRYFMATFTYNIRTIGGVKKKIGGERSIFN